jgi:hypothetical protein
MSDPWCQDCRFWKEEPNTHHVIGRCRRFPPVPIKSGNESVWPVTVMAEWCGEYQYDPVRAKLHERLRQKEAEDEAKSSQSSSDIINGNEQCLTPAS